MKGFLILINFLILNIYLSQADNCIYGKKYSDLLIMR